MIILIITVIIISLILMILKKFNKYKDLNNQEQEYIDSINNPGMIINGAKPQELKFDNIFFSIEECLQKYLEYVKNKNKDAVYSILDKQYIMDNNISKDNVLEIIPQYKDKPYRIKIIYVITGDKYSTYYINGILDKENIFFVVNTDTKSNAFSVIPSNEKIYNQKINEVIETDNQYEETIELNEYNRIVYKYLEEKDIIDKYFQDYLNNALYNPEIAYELLDEQYREKRFGSLNNYKEYIKENSDQISKMCKKTRKKYDDFSDYSEYEEYYISIFKYGIDKYQITQKDDGKQYICIDTYGNYYIFNINSIMNYTLILDTYTIDLPEFIEKYYGTEPTEKVALNIQKIFEAINNKDYNYVYGKLADGFKKNYFPTLDSFEKYAKEKFYDRNEVEYLFYEKESEEYYSYTIKISDKDTGKSKNLKIIMQLQSGTNFVMSFNVN